MELSRTIEQIALADIQSLVDAKIPESETLEYKRQPYGEKPEHKKEFMKDVSALANANGGWLLIGIEEKKGVPSGILPITDGDPEAMKRRFNDMLIGIEPRIFGMQSKALPVGGEGYVLVVWVPKSSTPPHRVTAEKLNKFYRRQSTGVYEPTYSELRSMFLQTASISERINGYRRERLERLHGNNGIIPLRTGGGLLVVHIIPQSFQTDGMPFNAQEAHFNAPFFSPIGMESQRGTIFNIHGVLVKEGPVPVHRYTQLFREGSVESVTGQVLDEHEFTAGVKNPVVNAHAVVDIALEGVIRFIQGLQQLKNNPPFYVGISLLGVSGSYVLCKMGVQVNHRELASLQDRDLLLPLCLISEYGPPESYRAALKPAFDALWNSGGLSEWVPK